VPLGPIASTSSLPYLHEENVGPNVRSTSKGYLLNFFLRPRLVLLLVVWCYCVVAWTVGAFILPTLEIQIMPGTAFTGKITKSLAMTLVSLYENKTYLAFSLLAFFSVVVPSVKLVCTLWLIVLLYLRSPETVYQRYHRMIWVLTYLASYQLTDLYVGVLFVSYFNSDSADAKFLVGFYWFFRYCIVSMVMSIVLEGAFENVIRDHDTTLADPNKGGVRGGGYMGIAVTESSPSDLPGPSHKKEQLDECQDINKVTNSCTVNEAQSFNPRSGNDEWKVCLSPPRLHDAKSASFFSACFVILLVASFFEPMLEVRTLWSGVAVDRSAHALWEIFMVLMPRITASYLYIIFLLMNLVLPLIYVIVLLASAAYPPVPGCSFEAEENVVPRVLATVADLLRPWVTTDVLTIATLIFLFTVQDEKTKTMTPPGCYTFYMFLGAGFSFFFLRWFTETGAKEVRQKGVPKRFIVLIAMWLALCLAILHGVPGSVPEFDFPNLNSVCRNTLPLVNSTLRQHVPASYGDCGDNKHRAPRPCKGDSMLYNTTNGNGFIEAKWLAG